MNGPIAIDLFCGLGGWTDGLLAEGYDVIGFDIEEHVYGEHRYPARLVLQDVLTLRGSQFKDAALIVASPPCQEYSYMAMPWTRAKQIAAALRGNGDFPEGYKGSRTVEELNALFNACFRIQREACGGEGLVPMTTHLNTATRTTTMPNPWLPYDGSGMPVDGETAIHVLCRKCDGVFGAPAGTFDWKVRGAKGDITHYRLADEEKD